MRRWRRRVPRRPGSSPIEMNPSREQLQKAARRALSEAKDPRKAAALVAAGTAAAAGYGVRRLRGGDGASSESDAYRLLPREPVAAGLKRIVGARVDDAIAQLRGQAET